MGAFETVKRVKCGWSLNSKIHEDMENNTSRNCEASTSLKRERSKKCCHHVPQTKKGQLDCSPEDLRDGG